MGGHVAGTDEMQSMRGPHSNSTPTAFPLGQEPRETIRGGSLEHETDGFDASGRAARAQVSRPAARVQAESAEIESDGENGDGFHGRFDGVRFLPVDDEAEEQPEIEIMV